MKRRVKAWIEAHERDLDAAWTWLEGYAELVLAPVLYGLWYALVVGVAVHGVVTLGVGWMLAALGLGAAPFVVQALLALAAELDDGTQKRLNLEAMQRSRDARAYDAALRGRAA